MAYRPIIERSLKTYAARAMKHAALWGVLALAFLPLLLMLSISLKSNAQFYTNPFGLSLPPTWSNWAKAWGIVGPYVANTAVVSITSTIITLCLAMAGAYFFARIEVPFSRFLWHALVFLMMLPAIANLTPLFILLRELNLLNTLWALIFVTTATGQAVAIFVLRNFIGDLPQELFEAAEVDGAGHVWQFSRIVVPLSGPIVGSIGIIHLLHVWNDFLLPLVVLRDPEKWTITLGLMRLDGEYVKYWGIMMAGYTISSIPIVILFFLAMRLFVRGLTAGAVKG
jgi:ABC-type glycerol-3-phosphate transport system permease component